MFGFYSSIKSSVRGAFDFARVQAIMLATGKAIELQAAEFLYERVMHNCPVRTGYMKSTVGMEDTGDGYAVSVVAKYAVYVEHGHFTSRQVFIPPNPFLRTSIQETADRFPSIARSFHGFKHEKTVSAAKNPNMSGPRIHTVATEKRKRILESSGEIGFSSSGKPLGVEIRKKKSR